MNKDQQLSHDLAHRLRLMDVLDRITQISLANENMGDVLRGVLDLVLEVFNADRAWFLYACDPDVPFWGVPMERTRPGWPGLAALGEKIAMNSDLSEIFSELLRINGTIQYLSLIHIYVVVLAVKPQQMQAVAIQLGQMLSARTIVLTIAAGIRIKDLAYWLGNQSQGFVLVRAMPNMPALVGAGITGIGLYSFPPEHFLTPEQKEKVISILGSVGQTVWVRGEDDMDAVTAISGSGPAYFFYFIEALEQAGKELGLPEPIARKLALETAFGAAKLAHESTEDPATLRARVTSKNGTTERALLSMRCV